jgi:hypothetical protein
MNYLKIITCKIFLSVLLTAILFSGCDKNDVDNATGTVKFGITDSRVTATTKSAINAELLTQFELTISKIELKNSESGYVTVLESPVTVDLRDFQGVLKNLGEQKIPVGSYTEILITVTGVKISYSGNVYESSVNGETSLSLGDLPGTVFTPANGVPDYFTSEMSFIIPVQFDIAESNTLSMRIQLDVLPSCYEISFNCPVCTVTEQIFAGLNNYFFFSVVFEEGIQQIKHSPPLNIKITGADDVNYTGIHTFVDFNGVGGSITAHTSQHVYRGEDGSLLVDVEDMAVNTTPLNPAVIQASGETDVQALEVFHYSAYKAKLQSLGYQLISGKTYYFSLRKKWTISSGNSTYEITRLCEPIPVVWQ